jgi:hypothetical protein
MDSAPAPSPSVQNAQIRKNRHLESSCCLFTLLFKPLCFLNKLQALFYHHFTNQTQPGMTEKLDILGWSKSKLPAKFEIFQRSPNTLISLILL